VINFIIHMLDLERSEKYREVLNDVKSEVRKSVDKIVNLINFIYESVNSRRRVKLDSEDINYIINVIISIAIRVIDSYYTLLTDKRISKDEAMREVLSLILLPPAYYELVKEVMGVRVV